MAQVTAGRLRHEVPDSRSKADVNKRELDDRKKYFVREYDFLSPKKFSKDQIKLLTKVFETFSRLIGIHLSGILRMTCEAEILNVTEKEFREYESGLEDVVLIGIIRMQNREHGIDDKRILLEMSRPVSFSILDRLLGGKGEAQSLDRQYTDIEVSLFEYLYRQFATVLQNSWGNFIEADHMLDMIETNSQMIQFIGPEESVAVATVNLTVGEARGTLKVCLPAAALEEFFYHYSQKFAKVLKKNNSEQDKLRRDSILTAISDTPLNIKALLGKAQITLQELLELKAGDILPLDTPDSNDTIIIDVEGEHWFYGSVGIKKKKFAVKIVNEFQ